jgi:type VI secretion system protein ImpL
MSWPGKDGTGVVSLAFQPLDGSPEVVVNETGSWAWLRMLRAGHFAKTALPDAYNLRLGANNYYVDLELRASSVENPYTLEMFKGFTCPPNI